MTIASDNPKYKPETRILGLGAKIGDPVAAAVFPKTILRYRNQTAAEQVGLDQLTDAEWVDHFGQFAPLPGSLEQPLALRYHGHQFQHYNPDIGDGRGFLFAQLRDHLDRLMDLGTKGSGQTPYSRSGDGRLTLKGGVREILATEMLEALGVPTSRTFSIIETGEQLYRGDEPSPTRGAAMVRLNYGHIRIGTFQRAAAERNADFMQALVDYVLRELYRVTPEADAPSQLLGLVVERTADLAASYMVAGFVHGVLNSDNINVTGESFDYGPWRFTPHWDPDFTAAYFDHNGLYAFGRQADAIHWDVAQLAVSLRLISEAPPLIAQLERFPALFEAALARRFCWRLGVVADDAPAANTIVSASIAAMTATSTPIDQFFFDWRGGVARTDQSSTDVSWHMLRDAMANAHPVTGCRDHAYWRGPGPVSMHIDTVEALWAAIAERDDWQPLYDAVASIRAMGAAHG